MAMNAGKKREDFGSSGFMELLKQAKSIQVQILLREIGHKFPGSTADKLRAEARASFKIDSVKDYNFGITGQSGVGKSSLVNAICGYADDHPKAAPIGITQCTMAMERYQHPFLKHLVLYDLPGAGTEAHPIEKYFCDKRLYVFDCLLLVMTQRVYQNDLAIAKLAQEMKTPVIFVRNKALNDLNTMLKKSENKYRTEEEVIKLTVSELKQDTIKELKNVGIDDPVVFVIEAHSFNFLGNMKFDELDLIDHVTKIASARKKDKKWYQFRQEKKEDPLADFNYQPDDDFELIY